jgi:hypothetical protein
LQQIGLGPDGQSGPRVHFCLQGELLIGALELPATQRGGCRHREDGGECDDPKAACWGTHTSDFSPGLRRGIIHSMKYLVIASFVAIIGSLGMALVFMMRGGNQDKDANEEVSSPSSRRMAKALAFRIGFSVLLFAVVLICYWMGWIQPTGLPLNR